MKNPETEMESFSYKPLTEPDSFRLILLQPSLSHDAELHCSLLHSTLSLCDRDIIDQYTALSYVWGDPSNTGCIYIDGTPITITATLQAALRDLRDSSRVVRIWADALCIDQSNLTERASQVGLMAQIYATAQHTVIHLWPSTDAYGTVLRAVPSNTSGVVERSLTASDLVELAERSILKSTWFTRVWVFQELVLSRDPWVQCSTLRARWTNLCSILLNQAAGRPKTKEVIVLEDMNKTRGPYRQKMFNLLTSRRGLGATDPRDMIYAHMGTSSDLNELKRYVEVDYRKECTEVYEDTARYLLDSIGPLGPESFFSHADDREFSKQKDLASWVPDWSVPSSNFVPMYRNNIMFTTKLDPKVHYAFVSKPPILAYIGYEVDVVGDFSLVLPDPQKLSTSETYLQSIRALETFYHTGPGVWWSGDEKGQYRHVKFSGREKEHETLSRGVTDEWLRIMRGELPSISLSSPTEEIMAHMRFLPGFETWLEHRARQQTIIAGGDSEGMASLMWLYLRQDSLRKVLIGRRFAITESGRVAIVPKQVRQGDIIVYLAGSLVSLVLRRGSVAGHKDLDLEIKEAFWTKGVTSPLLDQLEKMLIENCTLVGECYVDSEVGWKVKEDQERSYTIYALR
jgi:hypothetical protein